MTASLRSTGRQKYILQYVSWFTVSSTFYSQVNHKFEGRSVGEDSLRQMFVKWHAFIQSTSGPYVKWVWGVFGPLSPNPMSLIKSAMKKCSSVYLCCIYWEGWVCFFLFCAHSLKDAKRRNVKYFSRHIHVKQIKHSLNSATCGRYNWSSHKAINLVQFMLNFGHIFFCAL